MMLRLLSVCLLGLSALVQVGCCCHKGRGCGYAAPPSPCGPCGAAPAYAPSPGYAPAPALGAPGGCPSCGPGGPATFGPTGALPGTGAPVAFVPDPITGQPLPTTASLPTPVYQ